MFGRRRSEPSPPPVDAATPLTLDAEARRARAALEYLRRTDRRSGARAEEGSGGPAGREWRELRRRRQKRAAGRLVAWITTFGVAVALGGGGWFGGRAAFALLRRHTDVFRVQSIRVIGNERLTNDEVVAAAGVAVGQDLLALRPDSLRAAVARLPRVKSVTVDRSLKRELTLGIEERRPCALLLLADTWEVDEEGVLLPPDGTGRLADLPVIVGLPADSARVGARPDLPGLPAGLLLAGRLAQAGMLDAVSDIDVTQPDSLVLILQPGGVAVRAGDGDVPVRRLQALTAVRDDLENRAIDPAYIDIRFAGLVAVKPLEGPGAADAAAPVALASVTPAPAAAASPPKPSASGVLAPAPKSAPRPRTPAVRSKANSKPNLKTNLKPAPKKKSAAGKTVTGKAGRKPAPKKPAQGQRRPHGQHT